MFLFLRHPFAFHSVPSRNTTWPAYVTGISMNFPVLALDRVEKTHTQVCLPHPLRIDALREELQRPSARIDQERLSLRCT